MVIRVYWASVTCNRKIDGDQTRLRYLIESLKLESQWVDVTTDSIILKRMREECGKPKALPPQIFNDDVFLGDVDAMNQSIEDGRLKEWLTNEESTNIQLPLEMSQIPFDQNVQSVTHTSTVVNVTSATENIRPEPSVKIEETVVIVKAPIVIQKSVSSAISTFENKQRSPPAVQRQAVKIQFANENNNNDNIENGRTELDEERRRRILGLPPTGGEEINCLQDKTNDASITNSETSKMVVGEFKAFQGVQVTNSATASD